MKKIKLSNLLLIAALFFIVSCEDEASIIADPCDNITCGVNETCVNGTCVMSANPTINKSGLITANETWVKDNIYVLNQKVIVSEGATLTIEPGTIIKGAQGNGSLAAALVIARGAKIMADGTAAEPIIFTSVLDGIEPGQTVGTLDVNQNGLWGGLIILGKAKVSAKGSGDVAQIEGIPADETFGTYGGDNDTDNSGVLRYVSVRHGGILIGSDNEINGITFGGVGSGTVVDHIEVVANKDDGLEFFGGSVNVSNAIVYGQGDDAYDIDQSYSGTISNWVYIAGADSDHALEVDGPESSLNSNGKFTMTNGTAKGLASEYADFRDGAQGTVQNSYFFNYPENADWELDAGDNDDEIETSQSYIDKNLTFTGIEINVSHLAGGNNTIPSIFSDKYKVNGTAVNDPAFDASMQTNSSLMNTPTIGANTTVFDWTFTSQSGTLNF